MSKFLRIFINPEVAANERVDSAYKQQMLYLKKVWQDNTYGLERIARLFLCLVQFIYPILLIRDIFGRFGSSSRKLAAESYVFLKALFPFIVLIAGLYRYNLIIVIIVYLLGETIFHLLNLIFLSDVHSSLSSYRRSMLLLSLNYMEVIFDFSILYIAFDLLSEKLNWVSALYFSLVTNATVGFGDIYPKAITGRITVIFQLLICVLFVMVFINYFSQRQNEK